jgi:hypothetical protein
MTKLEVNLNTNEPWINQLKRLEHDLIVKALTDSQGNKSEASRLLGINVSTLKKRINSSMQLKQVVKQSKPKRLEKPHNSVSSIILHFLLGKSIKEISKETRCAQSKIMDKLRDNLGAEQCKKILETNEKRRNNSMMSIDQIVENNRQLLAVIAESIRENKELSEENLTYARILFNNGFINEKGEVTEEGREALYH